MGYQKDTIRGISWMTLLRGSTRALSLAKTLAIGRLLIPAQFGIWSIAALVLAFLEILTETGINIFLIQENKQIEEYIDTAWVISIVRGIIIGVLIVTTAPLIALFFKNPESVQFIQLLSIVPILRGFLNPAEVRFQKELQFKKEFIFRVTIFFVDTLVTITTMFILRTPVSLILGMTTGVTLELILSFIFIKPRPHLKIETKKLRSMLNRGKWITAAGVFQYLFSNFDNIVVGRILGAGSLGLYQMAYTISSVPVSEVADVSSRVTFPVYVKISGDKKRLKRAFLKTTVAITLATIPIGIILFLFSREIILILGVKWLGAVPALKVLALYGVIRAISGSSSALFLAIKKQQYVTALTLASILGLGIPIIPLVNRFGIQGAGTAVIIGSVAAIPIIVYCLYKTFK
jgi:O-antigen/teichoic acid export membrane protein